ncbi:MAG TPA: response regulator [Pedobacter sp.]|nr:response regulator [Pedobacter sp.]
MAKRILVIDDDEDILNIFNIVFGEAGYEVIISQTGTDTAHIKLLHPDLILLDVRITGSPKSGPEICKEIKKEFELITIPVLLVSAEPDIVKLAGACGANGYLPKPFDIDKLLAKVEEFVT